MAKFDIKVAKAEATFHFSEEDINSIPEDTIYAIWEQGLKHYMSQGLAGDKFKTKGLEGAELAAVREKVKEVCEENRRKILAGELKATPSKAAKTSGAVNTEAMRIARLRVKAQMKAKKIKVSYVSAAEITRAARTLVAEKPEILVEAQANIDRATAAANDDVIEIKIDPARKAKADKKAAEEKAARALSAKQAGTVQKRSGKGQSAQA